MSISDQVRRAAIIATVAVAFGAAGAVAASPPPPDDAPTAASEVPAPPVDTPPSADATDPDDAATSTTIAPDTTDDPAATPPTTELVTTSTTPPVTTSPAQGKPTTSTTPASAIATATTQPAPANAVATPAAAVAASAPRSPVAKAGNRSVTLTWQAPASNGGATIDKYAVQRSTNGSNGWTSIGGTTSLTHTATALTNGTKYYFRIAAHNSAGYGPFSTIVSATPRAVPTAPRSPAATPANGSVKLTWVTPTSNGGAAIDKYYVQRSPNGANSWTTIGTPTGTTFTATALTNGTKYYFRIIAHNSTGFSPSSTIINATPRTVPSAPLSVVATPGNGTITLTWHAPTSSGGAAIDKYAVQVSLTGTTGWGTLGSPATTSYTATSMPNGTKLYFRIVAHNVAGYGKSSSVVNAVPRTVPGALVDCSATQPYGPGTTTMWVAWSYPVSNGGAPIDYFVVEAWDSMGYAGGAFVPSGTTHEQLQLQFGTLYKIRVAAVNAAGAGPWCERFAVLVP